MLKKNLSIILIVLLAMLMIAMIIWVFDKRIKNIEKKINHSSAIANNTK